LPGLIDGEHRFLIEPINNLELRLKQREVQQSLLVPIFWWQLKKDAPIDKTKYPITQK